MQHRRPVEHAHAKAELEAEAVVSPQVEAVVSPQVQWMYREPVDRLPDVIQEFGHPYILHTGGNWNLVCRPTK